MGEWGLVKSAVMLLITSAFVAAGAFILWGANTDNTSLLGIGVISFFGSGVPYSLLKLRQAIVSKRANVVDEPSTIRIFTRSPSEIAALTVMCAGLGIGCYLLLDMQPTRESVRLAGWVGVVMCGFGVVAIPVMGTLRPFRLTLSPHGLDYTLFKVGPIEWGDIVSARVGQMLRSEFISLELTDQEKYFTRGFPKRGRKSKWLGGSSPFVILPQQLGTSTDSILNAINLRLSAFAYRKIVA